MPRTRKSPPPALPPEDNAELLRRLLEAVEAVAEELRVFRTVLDEMRDDFGWAIQNSCFRPAAVLPVTTMPRDPTAPDWSERLNRFGPHNLPKDLRLPEGPSVQDPQTPAQHRDLW